jgi:nucleoside-diphosphate-sugar epimerase
MNILVTGGAGYVGSVVIPELVNHNHTVKCLDRFFFGMEHLSQKQFENKVELIKDDIRWFNPKILDDVDIVMDLAALSNDPVGDLDPAKTYEINHLGRARVANLSKERGVSRYILASSASIYGQQEKIVDENGSIKPLTSYSKANRKAEESVLPLNDDNFTVTALRFSSVYGVSPRMRFDTAVNVMVLDLFNKGKITVRGQGNKRPFVHILDVARAYEMVIKASKEKIEGQIFNVGSDEQNYEMGQLAKEITNGVGEECQLELEDSPDHRSYAASFKKIRETLNFLPNHTIRQGAKEIHEALKSGRLKETKKTKTVEWYKTLLSDKALAQNVILNEIII